MSALPCPAAPGTLAQQVSVVKAESCGGWEDDEAAVDMAVLWLDLASVYATGDPLAREDLTIALDRITVRPKTCPLALRVPIGPRPFVFSSP